ncbi:MAG: HD domain-containing phosphohydrolase [Saccharospirillum sp.]|uniref:HD domain-containing phosphohydrolase n=1 Tax=Saccharospirillum sp. TaxID=2033801 RepID=UPI0032986768
MTTLMAETKTAHFTPTILCVDDEEKVLSVLRRVLTPLNVRIEAFSEAARALEYVRANTVSVVISDMRMPSMSGAEFLAETFRLQPNAYRMLITGFSDLPSTVSAVNDGRIQRYLSKPWNNDALLAAVKEGLSYHELIEANYRLQTEIKRKNETLEQEVSLRTKQLRKALRTLQAEYHRSEEAFKGTINVLTNAVSVNPIADGHLHQNVSELAATLALKMELPDDQVERIRLAGQLINLGLLGVDPEILKKSHARLTVQEKNELKKHPQIAELILSPARHFDELAQILGSQNEAFNGAGYPHGLVGDVIPLGSRIVTVARDFWRFAGQSDDDFSLAYKKAVHQLKQGMGIHYDPDIVACLCELDLEEIKRFDEREHALTPNDLEPGMVLLDDLYNAAGLLLLAKDYVLTDEAISKLRDYQEVDGDVLFIRAEKTPECGATLNNTE